jgi:hypothetical protein
MGSLRLVKTDAQINANRKEAKTKRNLRIMINDGGQN